MESQESRFFFFIKETDSTSYLVSNPSQLNPYCAQLHLLIKANMIKAPTHHLLHPNAD